MTGLVEKVYSDALFELAEESGNSEEILQELNELAKIFNDNPELVKMLSAPNIATSEKIKSVTDIFGGRISELSMNFICVLTEKKRISHLPKIAEYFKKLYNEKNNIVEIRVTTCIPLSDTLREKLKNKLEAVYKKKVIMVEKIDKGIIGGIVINYGNTLIDGSVKTKLENMQKQIRDMIA